MPNRKTQRISKPRAAYNSVGFDHGTACHGGVVSTQLAPGVVLLGGGSHNSVAVEFKNYVVMIEGPLSNQRTNALVAETHKLFPNKPIKYLINTHNHFDHLGGVRGFVAEGATVITDDKNRNFYQRCSGHRDRRREGGGAGGVISTRPREVATGRLPAVSSRAAGFPSPAVNHGRGLPHRPRCIGRWARQPGECRVWSNNPGLPGVPPQGAAAPRKTHSVSPAD
jgi:hypothetical protein